ncbi:MAG: hypothetical protein ACTHL1_09195 [Burkholderiaceae bacterium]
MDRHVMQDAAPAAARPPRARRLRERIALLAGIAWASPLTLFGLLIAAPAILAPSGRIFRVRQTTPALLVTGPVAERLLALHPVGNVIAMAVGHLVLARQSRLLPHVLRHELAHVRQAARWGIAFPVAYSAAGLWQKLRGRSAYWNNPFEIAAREAEHETAHEAEREAD